MFKSVILLLLVLFSFSCSNLKKTITGEAKPEDLKHTITKDAMLSRSKSVENVSYNLSLDLSEKKESYKGRVEIFYTQKELNDLRVDFFNGVIDKLVVNGKKIEKINHNGFFLMIDEDDLKSGRSKIEISFTQTYSKSGEGFYRFVDPKDQKIYVYTDFEPYNANYLFPCFDQPNLKATYKLDVLAPKDWQVITSVYENKIQKTKKKSRWFFPVSQKFSTYIFNVTAGPYKRWDSKYVGERKIVPMRLYSRQSLAEHVEYKEWFDLTKKGMTFFGEYFGVDYPFEKYDQMLVPDFNWGGMENVGAVTYNEGNIYKSKPTKSQRERRANVIMHELAHMWFGNLVTMDWWNGLWLNESFATIMANIALNEATEFTDVWETFFNRTKGWAYWQDQLVTTHPIEVPVNDTDTAFTNFDGITYGKGASALKQLIYYLGDDFKKGIQHYFKTHAYKNTELQDFFNSMEYASNKDLTSWAKSWLYTAQVNTIEANYNCVDGKITDFSLKQTAPEKYPTLRTHKTLIGLYKNVDGMLVKYHDFPLVYSGVETKHALKEVKCPDLIYPNIDDHDYVKVTLDAKSLQTAKASISNIKSSMTRSMVWKSLWNMVREGEWSLDEFTELALENLNREKNRNIRKTLMRNLYRSGIYYYSFAKDLKTFQTVSKRLEDFAWVRVRAAKAGSDDQKEWFQTFVSSVRSVKGLKTLQGILKGKVRFPGLKIDQDRRWSMIEVINREGLKIGEDLIKKELKADKSSRGEQSALAARVSFPSIENKKKWFAEVIDTKTKRKLSDLRTIMRNLFRVGQNDYRQNFTMDWKSSLKELSKLKENHFLESFAGSLAPVFCNDSSTADIRAYINDNSKLSIAVVKELKVTNQENERCVNIVKKIK